MIRAWDTSHEMLQPGMNSRIRETMTGTSRQLGHSEHSRDNLMYVSASAPSVLCPPMARNQHRPQTDVTMTETTVNKGPGMKPQRERKQVLVDTAIQREGGQPRSHSTNTQAGERGSRQRMRSDPRRQPAPASSITSEPA